MRYNKTMDEVATPDAELTTETRIVLRPAVALALGIIVGVGVGIAVAAALTTIGREYGEGNIVVIDDEDAPVASIVIED